MTFTVHVVRPPIEGELEVLESYDRIYRSFGVASELWRLIGDEYRASEIDRIIERAFEHQPATLDTNAMAQLLALVEPLDKAIIWTLTDERQKLSPGRVVELRGRTDVFDLAESRGDDAQWAVGEEMVRISNLQNILQSAIHDGTYLIIE